MSEQECCIVLGSPRTGTSLTMGLLAAMGVYVGDDIRTGSNNPNYYEDRWLVDRFICPKKGLTPVTASQVVKRLAQHPKWGMKHPGIIERWEELKPHIPNPRFVVTYRIDFDAQFKSHHKAIRKQSRQAVKERNKNYYATVARITEGYPAYRVFFEDWFDPVLRDIQLQGLAGFAGLEVNDAARSLIDPRLKHY